VINLFICKALSKEIVWFSAGELDANQPSSRCQCTGIKEILLASTVKSLWNFGHRSRSVYDGRGELQLLEENSLFGVLGLCECCVPELISIRLVAQKWRGQASGQSSAHRWLRHCCTAVLLKDLSTGLTYLAVTSANQQVTRYTYDPRGLLSTTTDQLGGVVSFTYDSRRNLTTLSDQRGFTRTYTYDELSRGTSVRDPFGKASSVQYDAANNVIRTTDRLGRQVSAV